MSYRMNSFYTVSRTVISHPSALSNLQEDMVPFVAALSRVLLECQLQVTRPSIVTAMMIGTRAQFEADIKLMTDVVLAGMLFNLSVGRDIYPFLQVIRQRKESPTDPDAPQDPLDRMLTVVDTKTGEKMTDELIVENVGFFLVTLRRCSDLDPSYSRFS